MKSSIKFFTRHKLYTMVNFIGLTIALTFVLILATYIRKQLSTDSFHEKGDRIILVANDSYSSAYYLHKYLKERFPEIENATSVRKKEKMKFSIDTDAIHADVNLVDSSFFDIFSFKITDGNADTFKQSLYNIIVSQSFASKLFNGTDALGKTIKYAGYDLIVTGVMEDINNSVIPSCDILMRDEWMESLGPNDAYMSDAGSVATFVLVKENADLFSKRDEILSYFKEIWWIYKYGQYSKVHLIPLNEIYFYEDGNILHLNTGNKSIIMLLITVCSVILLFAILNYVVLTVSLMGFRAKEMTIRRILGSRKTSIAAMAILEAITICSAAMAVALPIAEALSPTISSFLEYPISVFEDLLSVKNMTLAISSIILIGCLAGLAPAIALTGTSSLEITNGTFRHKTKKFYSTALIITQNTITVCMLIAAITIKAQVHYLVNMDLGYKTDNILYVENLYGNIGNLDKVRDELLSDPSIKNVGYCQGIPLGLGNNNYMSWNDGSMTAFYTIIGDNEAFNILGFKKKEDYNAAPGALWLNESGLKEISAINRRLGFTDHTLLPPSGHSDKRMPIGGVYYDFKILGSLSGNETVGMRVLKFEDNVYPWGILIETRGDDSETYNKIYEIFRKHFLDIPFEASYLKDLIHKFYSPEIKTLKIVSVFTIISIIISMLGLFAISTYFMTQRQKDAGLKRTFGASKASIIRENVTSFVKYICIAIIAGIPIGWYIMAEWLKEFAYRIPMHWWIFALSTATILMVALLSTLWQCVRISNTNPSETLNKNL